MAEFMEPTRSADHIDEHSLDQFQYLKEHLVIFVLGASGDLAKKKTFPALLELYLHQYLPTSVQICGYARTQQKDADFRTAIKPFLLKHSPKKEKEIDAFLQLCGYYPGHYHASADIAAAFTGIEEAQAQLNVSVKVNHLFYFAIPPNVFLDSARSIKEAAMSKKGWNRLVMEKPFGKNTETFQALSASVRELFQEDQIYRIDHYLGKEMVQNLMIMRFANTLYEAVWNRNYIKSVTITFKEDIGTDGRGGYFDSFGIIRDVIQNHLTQVLSLVAMECPIRVAGGHAGNFIRDEKVKVLRQIRPIDTAETVLGQYVKSTSNPKFDKGYLDDPTVPSDSTTPTFAACVLYVENQRWDGVPFILKAGKALDVRKGEIRIQFHRPPACSMLFPNMNIPTNELVMRLQPEESVYMKFNLKSPGVLTTPIASELDLTYSARYKDMILPDAYTRLLLDVCRGQEATFVREDELQASWEIFSPWLKEIEEKKQKPILYEYGSRGPKEADELIEKIGYEFHHGDYRWHQPYA